MEISTNSKRFQRVFRAIKCYHKQFLFFWEPQRGKKCAEESQQSGRTPAARRKQIRFLPFFLFFSLLFFFFNFACMTWLRQVDESKAAKIKLRAKRARRTEWQFKKGFYPKDDLRRIGD